VNGNLEEDSNTVSSPEPEEYTYDRAIQGYVNFTENRVKKNEPAEGAKRPPTEAEKKADMERVQARNKDGDGSPPRITNGTAKAPNAALKVTVKPAVGVLRRKELFEKGGEEGPKIAPRAAEDLANSQSIRDRLSHLEKQKADEDKPKSVKRLSGEISVKDRLSILEKQKSSENVSKTANGRPTDVPLGQSVRDRLSSLGQAVTPDDVPKVLPDRDPTFQEKLSNFRNTECTDAPKDARSPSPEGAPENEDIYKRHFHRSLDSLDVDSESQVSNDVLERVRSLEDLSRNGPASASSNENFVFSSQSGDTDREDSGIHTTDVSCSVSQADEPADFDSEIGHPSPPVPQSKVQDFQDNQDLPVLSEARKPVPNAAIIVSPISGAPVVVTNSGGNTLIDLSLPPIPEILDPPSVVVTSTNLEPSNNVPQLAQRCPFMVEERNLVEVSTEKMEDSIEKVEESTVTLENLTEKEEESTIKVEKTTEVVEEPTAQVEESTDKVVDSEGATAANSTKPVDSDQSEQPDGFACGLENLEVSKTYEVSIN